MFQRQRNFGREHKIAKESRRDDLRQQTGFVRGVMQSEAIPGESTVRSHPHWPTNKTEEDNLSGCGKLVSARDRRPFEEGSESHPKRLFCPFFHHRCPENYRYSSYVHSGKEQIKRQLLNSRTAVCRERLACLVFDFQALSER